MWLCLNDGFLSVVADTNSAAGLMVRARRKRDLMNIFGSDIVVVETPDADYHWNVSVSRAEFKALVDRRIDGIDYTNFRNTVPDHDLHGMYSAFWRLHRSYQKYCEHLPPIAWRKLMDSLKESH